MFNRFKVSSFHPNKKKTKRKIFGNRIGVNSSRTVTPKVACQPTSPTLKKVKKEELYETYDTYNWPKALYVSVPSSVPTSMSSRKQFRYYAQPPPPKRQKVLHVNYNKYVVPKESIIANALWRASTRLPVEYSSRVSRYPPSLTAVVLPQPPSPVYLHEEFRKYKTTTRPTVQISPEDVTDLDDSIITTVKFSRIKEIDKTTKGYIGGKGNVDGLTCYTVKYLSNQSSTVLQIVGRVSFYDVTVYYDQYEKPVQRRGTTPGDFCNIIQRVYFGKLVGRQKWWTTASNSDLLLPANRIKAPIGLITHVFEHSSGELEKFKYYRYKPSIIKGRSIFSKNLHVPKLGGEFTLGQQPDWEHYHQYWEEWQSSWPYSQYVPEEDKKKYRARRRNWIYKQLTDIWLGEV